MKNKWIVITGLSLLIIVMIGAASVLSYSEKEAIAAASYPLSEASRPTGGIVLNANALTSAPQLTELQGKQQVVQWKEGEALTWNAEIPQAGEYELAVGYLPLEGSGQDIEFTLSVDGAALSDDYAPFKLNRLWQDEAGPYKRSDGNELRPKQLEAKLWQETTVQAPGELADGPLKLKLSAGQHTIKLQNLRESAAVDYIRLYQAKQLPTYAEYKQAQPQAGEGANVFIQRQAEQSYLKSAAGLFPMVDRTSPLTTPYSPYHLRLNTIGGWNWSNPGEWISWKLDVPEDGWYTIGTRYHQNEVKGAFVSRKVMIDGEVPFQELNAVRFPYQLQWNVSAFSDAGGKPYQFYLTKGTHEIKMEVTLGELAASVQTVQQLVFDMNQLYRQIVMITGINPDVYRDYEIDKSIPGLLGQLQQLSDRLHAEAEGQDKLNGQTNSGSRLMRLLERQIDGFIDRPDQLPKRLESYSNNIMSLADWMLTVKEQPLELDYLFIASPGRKLPRADANPLEQGLHEVRSFAGSFLVNYDSMSSDANSSTSINVWTGLGRDQAYVLKRLIDESFVPESGVNVNLSLVSDTLVKAVMAGEGPDVNLFTSRGDTMNLAIRGALEPLDQYSAFQSIKNEYMPTAFVPYQYKQKTFAIPDDQEFFMMFYRKDVLSELGLKAPQTWDDLMKIAPVLQNNNMQIGLPYENLDAFLLLTKGMGALNLFPTLLMQQGVPLYNEKQDATNFDDPKAYNAFKQWTDFYNLYDYPLYKDDFNRFRTGEMPIVIANYKLYTKLIGVAPEINGTWEMVPIPGMKREDGTINRATGATGTASVILKNTAHKDEAWAFLEWWNRPDIQAQFNRELENEMGILGRRLPANQKAFENSNWSRAEQAVLSEQWKQVEEIPELPGGYYTSRNIDNAFREVVFQMGNARESLFKWNKEINEEIKRKRYEFGVNQ